TAGVGQQQFAQGRFGPAAAGQHGIQLRMPGGLGRRRGNIRTALPHPPLLQQGVQGHHGAHGCRSGSEPVGMEDEKAGQRMTDTELLYMHTAYSLDNVWSIPERRRRMDGCDRQDELVPVLPGEGASVGQFDTIRVDADQALLVQAADGLLEVGLADAKLGGDELRRALVAERQLAALRAQAVDNLLLQGAGGMATDRDRKSTRLNSSHVKRSYAVFCLNRYNTE